MSSTRPSCTWPWPSSRLRPAQLESARVELATARHQAARLDAAALARFETQATLTELFLVDDRAALNDVVASGEALLRQTGREPWVLDRVTRTLIELHVGMGHARLQDDFPRSLRLLRDAAESARGAGLAALELAALAETCVPAITEGDLESTRLVAEQTLLDARTRGWADLRSLGPAHGYLGWLALWQGDARRSRDHLERCLDLLLPTDWGMRGLTLTTLAQTHLLAGDPAARRGGGAPGPHPRDLRSHAPVVAVPAGRARRDHGAGAG